MHQSTLRVVGAAVPCMRGGGIATLYVGGPMTSEPVLGGSGVLIPRGRGGLAAVPGVRGCRAACLE